MVDPAVLLRALDGGEITGVAINLLETEPPEAGGLLVTDEQILVPLHSARYSRSPE